jgi:hypothetical protein
MLRQDRDFSTIDAIKRQFEEQWRREKIVLFIWGLFPGPADDLCRKTTVTGTMQRGSSVYVILRELLSFYTYKMGATHSLDFIYLDG